MNKFSSYERIKVALEHKQTDRISFYLGTAAIAGINVNALRELRKYLRFSDEVTIEDKITQIAHIEDDLIDYLKIDIECVALNPPTVKGLQKNLGVENGYDQITDEKGMGMTLPISGGHYYLLWRGLLTDISILLRFILFRVIYHQRKSFKSGTHFNNKIFINKL